MDFGSFDSSTEPHDMAVETVSVLIDISRSNRVSNQQKDSPYFLGESGRAHAIRDETSLVTRSSS